MKLAILLGCVLLFVSNFPISAQTNEISQATGLPIPIGATAIYGQVALQGRKSSDPMPSVFVTLYIGGIQYDRKKINSDGYYYFLTAPRDGAYLIFEVEGMEAGRVNLASGTGSSTRQDIAVNWNAIQDAKRQTNGVVSAKDAYARSEENEKLFDRAMASARDKKFEDAAAVLNQIVGNDPNDFLAWTALGSVQFSNAKSSDAEASYKKAIELKPDFTTALLDLGRLYFSQKQYEKAIEVSLKAVAADPKSADAFHLVGEAYLQMKQGSKTVIAFSEAIRLSPDEKAELHLRLAALYNAAGAKDRAANEYKLFLAKKPGHPENEKLEKYIKENSK